jgi:predicted nucleic acid-binding protein
MNPVLTDAQYWVAILNDQDQSHAAAQAISQTLRGVPLVTTEEVLTEVLAFFCERGPYLRQSAVAFVESILSNPGVIVYQQSHQTFVDGLALYKGWPNKGYSLTDCISMLAMRRHGITNVLTNDDNFTRINEMFTSVTRRWVSYPEHSNTVKI